MFLGLVRRGVGSDVRRGQQIGDLRGRWSLSRLLALQLLEYVARIVDDLEPAVVSAGLEGFSFGAGVGEQGVPMAPVARQSLEMDRAYGDGRRTL